MRSKLAIVKHAPNFKDSAVCYGTDESQVASLIRAINLDHSTRNESVHYYIMDHTTGNMVELIPTPIKWPII